MFAFACLNLSILAKLLPRIIPAALFSPMGTHPDALAFRRAGAAGRDLTGAAAKCV
jgi:hypothetical protein